MYYNTVLKLALGKDVLVENHLRLRLGGCLKLVTCLLRGLELGFCENTNK